MKVDEKVNQHREEILFSKKRVKVDEKVNQYEKIRNFQKFPLPGIEPGSPG